MPRRGRDGLWQYLPLAGATKDAGIVRAKTSVLRRQNTVAQFVATRPIMVRCEGTEQRGGDMGPPKMVGTARDRLEDGAGSERKSGGGGRNIHKKNCRDATATTETETSGSEKGTGEEASLGASGSSGVEWSGA